MRLTLLATAGTILSAAADNPLRLLTHMTNDPNDSTVCGGLSLKITSSIYLIHLTNMQLSCIQDIDYSPPCDTSSTSCWCQDTTFMTEVNHCIIDTSSESFEGEFLAFQPNPYFR